MDDGAVPYVLGAMLLLVVGVVIVTSAIWGDTVTQDRNVLCAAVFAEATTPADTTRLLKATGARCASRVIGIGEAP